MHNMIGIKKKKNKSYRLKPEPKPTFYIFKNQKPKIILFPKPNSIKP